MKRFDNLPLAGKLLVLAAFAIVLLGLGGLVVAQQVRQQMTEARVQQLHATVETTISLAAALDAQVKAGDLTRDQLRPRRRLRLRL